MQVKRYQWQWQAEYLPLPIHLGEKPTFSYQAEPSNEALFRAELEGLEYFQLDEAGKIQLLLFKETFYWQSQNLFDLMEAQVVPLLDANLPRLPLPTNEEEQILQAVFADGFLRMLLLKKNDSKATTNV